MTLKFLASGLSIVALCLSMTACTTLSPEELACRKTELKTKKATVENMESWLERLDGTVPHDDSAPGGYTLTYIAPSYSTTKEVKKSALDKCLDNAVEVIECEKHLIQRGGHKFDVTRTLLAPPRLRLSACTGEPMKHWVIPSRESNS